MKKSMLMVLACIATATLVACGSESSPVTDTPEQTVPDTDPVIDPAEGNDLKTISLTQAEQLIVNNNNRFALNLMRTVLLNDENTGEKSIILSPISITYALGMLNNGAAGETRQQINTVLGFDSADEVNAFCKKMLTEAPSLDKLTRVSIANTIYMNIGYELKPVFQQTANSYYNAQPETRDFADGKTMDVINQWASDHTEKMIDKVLDESSFDPTAVSYLLNAIYFKGAWTQKFDKAQTVEEAFNGGKKVPMMHQENTFSYGATDDYQMLNLPYGNKAYTMTILLPREGKTVSDVMKGMTADSWRETVWRMSSVTVDVKLPRFESKTDIDLPGIMSELGMPNAFNPEKAEFPDFCNKPTYIDMMKQVARIKLSEEGTEAAAVTVIGMKENSAGSSEPQRVTFHATRPFLYVISEQSTGAIFFVGTYIGD